MAREGEAFIEVHADTDPFAREAQRGVRRGAEAAEDDLEDVGDEWGKTLSDAVGDRLEREGPTLARDVERGLSKEKITVKIEYDRDNNVIKRTVTSLFREIDDAVSEAVAGGGGGGGPFGKLGQAFGDAIGAGFNVSGRSPLIAFLLPLVGVIIGVVGAAIQALNALAAVAITLPGILASIGIQVGVLVIAFDGLGTAIQGAFAATNAKELKEALKDLAPAAQSFVKELLPLKDFFFQLRGQVQQNFFEELQGLFTQIYRTQGPTVFDGMLKVATALGGFFRNIGDFFTSDTFSKFLNEVFPRTVIFLEQFGPSFVSFLNGLLSMVNVAMPFLTKVGDLVSMIFKQVGDAFKDVSNDPDFPKFLESMESTLMSIIQLFRAAGIFIGALFTAVDKAGGQKLIDKFAEALIMLAVFLTSDAGIKGMTALIEVAIFSIQVVTGLIIVFLFALGAIREFFIFLGTVVVPAILYFFGAAANAVESFFVGVGKVLTEFWNFLWWIFVGGGINQVSASVVAKFGAIKDFLGGWVTNIKNWFASIPDRIKEVFSNAVNFLRDAGRNIVQGLINGVKEMIAPLKTALGFVGGIIGGFFPHSPAKEGPLSGKGDPRFAGQEIVRRVASGMEMEAPTLRAASVQAAQNVMFGPGSIVNNFNGMPTRDEARVAGNSVAQGILNGLQVRDMRLSVRAL